MSVSPPPPVTISRLDQSWDYSSPDKATAFRQLGLLKRGWEGAKPKRSPWGGNSARAGGCLGCWWVAMHQLDRGRGMGMGGGQGKPPEGVHTEER